MRLSGIAKKMIMVICVSLGLLTIVSIAYYRSFAFLPFMFGLMLGTALNVFKVIMLDRVLDKASGMEQQKLAGYVQAQHFIKFLCTAAVLVVSALVPFISLWGAAAGIVTWQLALFLLKFFPDKLLAD